MAKLLEMYSQRLLNIQKRYEENGDKSKVKKELQAVIRELKLWSRGL